MIISNGNTQLNSAREALMAISAGKVLIASTAIEARRIVTCSEVLKFARALNQIRAFKQDLHLPGFESAFGNYHVGLWRWVWGLNPPNVIDKLNDARFDIQAGAETSSEILVRKHYYMLWRAIFLAGIKAGEGFKPEHYRYFARYARVADAINDEQVFEQARQQKWNWKPGKVQKNRTQIERQLRFCLLISWLAGGLWHMGTRQGQLDALKRWWPEIPDYSPDAVAKAQKRLGLRWPTNHH